jgi:hypothetical protein
VCYRSSCLRRDVSFVEPDWLPYLQRSKVCHADKTLNCIADSWSKNEAISRCWSWCQIPGGLLRLHLVGCCFQSVSLIWDCKGTLLKSIVKHQAKNIFCILPGCCPFAHLVKGGGLAFAPPPLLLIGSAKVVDAEPIVKTLFKSFYAIGGCFRLNNW